MRIGMGRQAVVVIAAACVAATVGCASLDEHRQLEMDHRTLLAEKEQVDSDLYDCRNVTDNLRTQLDSCQNELDTNRQLVDNYRQENDRLAQKVDELTVIVDKVVGGKDMQKPLIIERVLPPALDAALKEFAADHPDMITYDAKRGAVKWQSDLLFALASVVVRDSAKASLTEFARIVDSPAAGEFDVLIVGHTDNIPIKRSETMKMHPTNWHLSVHRAISVSNVLQKDGLSPKRLGVMGFGEYRPVADNNTDAGRAKNRRVEIFLVRKQNMLAARVELEAALARASE
jgi:chemotaxis protein MotB